MKINAAFSGFSSSLPTKLAPDLDQAFQSPIYLSFYYAALSKDVTLKIWKMNIKTAKQLFKEKQRGIMIEDEDILRLVKKHY